MDYLPPSRHARDLNKEERQQLNRNQVKTIDNLISGAINSIDNLILKTEGPNAQLTKDNEIMNQN